jgi:hypothetical protein
MPNCGAGIEGDRGYNPRQVGTLEGRLTEKWDTGRDDGKHVLIAKVLKHVELKNVFFNNSI